MKTIKFYQSILLLSLFGLMVETYRNQDDNECQLDSHCGDNGFCMKNTVNKPGKCACKEGFVPNNNDECMPLSNLVIDGQRVPIFYCNIDYDCPFRFRCLNHMCTCPNDIGLFTFVNGDNIRCSPDEGCAVKNPNSSGYKSKCVQLKHYGNIVSACVCDKKEYLLFDDDGICRCGLKRDPDCFQNHYMCLGRSQCHHDPRVLVSSRCMCPKEFEELAEMKVRQPKRGNAHYFKCLSSVPVSHHCDFDESKCPNDSSCYTLKKKHIENSFNLTYKTHLKELFICICHDETKMVYTRVDSQSLHCLPKTNVDHKCYDDPNKCPTDSSCYYFESSPGQISHSFCHCDVDNKELFLFDGKLLCKVPEACTLDVKCPIDHICMPSIQNYNSRTCIKCGDSISCKAAKICDPKLNDCPTYYQCRDHYGDYRCACVNLQNDPTQHCYPPDDPDQS